jgi:hypothetical protein
VIKNILAPWQKGPQGRVFISYRRGDTQWVAGRLADSLSHYFGDDRVFRDVEGIGGGADFGEVIHGTLGQTDAVVVLIGDTWLSVAEESGQRRLDDPGDWVAQEIATALKAGIPVYPVLVEGTQMPRGDELPERLRALARYNAVSISDSRWDNDVARLAKIIGLDIPSATERKLNGLNLLISLVLLLPVLVTCGILAWNVICLIAQTNPRPDWLSVSGCPTPETPCFDSDPKQWPLSLAQSGITFLAIVPCSVLLFVFARLVEETRRSYFLAAAWLGAIGSTSAFILLKPIPDPYEPIAIFFGATVTALLMFAFMNLSGFRPK